MTSDASWKSSALHGRDRRLQSHIYHPLAASLRVEHPLTEIDRDPY